MGMSAAIGMTLAGGGLSANAQLQSGRLNQQIYNYDAKVADLQADDALARGRELEGQKRLQIKSTIATQRVRQAASGVDVTRGSALDVQADTAALGERDVAIIRNNAAREAWGYKVQSSDYLMRGQVARSTGKMNAVGTLVSSGAKAAEMKWG